MRPEDVAAFGSLIPYWAFGIATAASFYGGMIWVGNHFKPEFKVQLGEWLNGRYESNWTQQFCLLFDTVFGPKHLSLKRFFRSAIASAVSVIVLYILFAQVLGVLGTRTFGTVSLWYALLLGVAINIFPDYLSLVETRWLLERFEKIRTFPGQLALLFLDLVFSAAIIFAGIYLYTWLSGAGSFPSPIEIVALFSIYGIFFYSTFLTSVWAWVYCISTWFVRIFTRLGLRGVLDVKENPVKQIALVGSALMILGGMALVPIVRPGKDGFVAEFDKFLCSFDVSACFHAARVANDLPRVVQFMEAACHDERRVGNCAAQLDQMLDTNDQEIINIWTKACDGGFLRGCRALGWNYELGEGVKIDFERAASLYRKACDGADKLGCINLGLIFEFGKGVQADAKRAVELYRQACDGEEMLGCSYLGVMYEFGRGVNADPKRAVELFGLACDGQDMRGCNNLGLAHENATGTKADAKQAAKLYRQACDGGYVIGCNNLGRMYDNGEGVETDAKRAAVLYRQACDGKEMIGCSNLGVMYLEGKGVEADVKRAVELYRQACDGQEMLGCYNLGTMFENGKGVEADEKRAVELYQLACDGGIVEACGHDIKGDASEND